METFFKNEADHSCFMMTMNNLVAGVKTVFKTKKKWEELVRRSESGKNELRYPLQVRQLLDRILEVAPDRLSVEALCNVADELLENQKDGDFSAGRSLVYWLEALYPEEINRNVL